MTTTLPPGFNDDFAASPGETIKATHNRTNTRIRIMSTGTAPAPEPAPAPAPEPTPTPTTLPPVRPLAALTVRPAPVPAYLTRWTDPDLGTVITRITNTPGLRHPYARLQPENADGSLILANFTPSSGRLIDGHTFADRGAFRAVPFAVWSNVDPYTIYGAQGNALVRQDVRTDASGGSKVIRDLGAPVTLRYEQGVADDDSAIALAAGGWMYLVDPRSGSILASTADPGGDNLQVSRRGSRVIVVAGSTRAYLPSAASLVLDRTLFPTANHGDNWLDPSGNEWFVSDNAIRPGESQGHVLAARLSDGTITELLPTRTAFENGHTSGRGPEVVLSTYDPIGMAGRPGCDQVVSIAPGGVRVWAFSRRSLTKAYSAMTSAERAAAYAGEPQAVPSRDGRRVYFASDWGGSVYMYVAEAA